jgi:hypothetical protein
MKVYKQKNENSRAEQKGSVWYKIKLCKKGFDLRYNKKHAHFLFLLDIGVYVKKIEG